MYLLCMLYCKSLLLLLRCDTGKVRDNYKCNYMQVYFFKYKYNVKTCIYTISPLYQIIHFNVSTVHSS